MQKLTIALAVAAMIVSPIATMKAAAQAGAACSLAGLAYADRAGPRGSEENRSEYLFYIERYCETKDLADAENYYQRVIGQQCLTTGKCTQTSY